MTVQIVINCKLIYALVHRILTCTPSLLITFELYNLLALLGLIYQNFKLAFLTSYKF